MFPIPLQGLIASKCTRVIDGPFPGLGLDMPREFFGTDRLDAFRRDAGFTLQETENNAFAGSWATTVLLASAPKVDFIHFNFALEFPSLQLRQIEQGFSQALIDSGHDFFDIDAQILGQPIDELELIEPLENANLPTQATEMLALPTDLTFELAMTGVQSLKRTTKDTRTPAQRVGRTTNNRVSSCNHVQFLPYIGYETP